MGTKLFVWTLSSMVLTGFLFQLWAFQPEPAQKIMWRKLDLSHAMLDALALDDFEALEAYAEDMSSLSEAAKWFVGDSEESRQLSDEFRTSVETLESAARDRNTDVAVFAYIDLTLRCIRCHQELGRVPRQ